MILPLLTVTLRCSGSGKSGVLLPSRWQSRLRGARTRRRRDHLVRKAAQAEHAEGADHHTRETRTQRQHLEVFHEEGAEIATENAPISVARNGSQANSAISLMFMPRTGERYRGGLLFGIPLPSAIALDFQVGRRSGVVLFFGSAKSVLGSSGYHWGRPGSRS
jgi:hypothetical protein